jgi:hypothetical protein
MLYLTYVVYSRRLFGKYQRQVFCTLLMYNRVGDYLETVMLNFTYVVHARGASHIHKDTLVFDGILSAHENFK